MVRSKGRLAVRTLCTRSATRCGQQCVSGGRSRRSGELKVSEHRQDVVADHLDSDIPPRFRHVLLNVENRLQRRPDGRLVLEDLLGFLGVVDLRDEAAPRADRRLDDRRVSDLIERPHRGLGRECDDRPRRRHARLVEGAAQRVRYVDIPADRYDGYYNGIANGILWFAHHYLWDLPRTPSFGEATEHDWSDYVEVNRSFARVLASEAKQDPVYLIQDYHLSLVPRMLRELFPDALIAHFSHTSSVGSGTWGSPSGRRYLHSG